MLRDHKSLILVGANWLLDPFEKTACAPMHSVVSTRKVNSDALTQPNIAIFAAALPSGRRGKSWSQDNVRSTVPRYPDCGQQFGSSMAAVRAGILPCRIGWAKSGTLARLRFHLGRCLGNTLRRISGRRWLKKWLQRAAFRPPAMSSSSAKQSQFRRRPNDRPAPKPLRLPICLPSL